MHTAVSVAGGDETAALGVKSASVAAGEGGEDRVVGIVKARIKRRTSEQ